MALQGILITPLLLNAELDATWIDRSMWQDFVVFPVLMIEIDYQCQRRDNSLSSDGTMGNILANKINEISLKNKLVL